MYDELGAGIGSRIALSEGGEAAQPFRPEIKPVDAYNAAVLDQVEMGTEVAAASGERQSDQCVAGFVQNSDAQRKGSEFSRIPLR